MTIPASDNRGSRPKRALGKLVPAALVAIALLTSSASSVARHDSPRIIPPDGHFHGLTYGEWQVKYNQWVYGVSSADNATLLGNEDTLAVGQPKHLWFLSNTSPVVDRHFVVPKGKALWLTIFGVEWDNFLCAEPDTHYTVAELRDITKSIVDSMTDIEVTIDGVPVDNIMAYRSITPEFSLNLPDHNVLLDVFGCTDALAGTYGPAVGDARALILKPLPVGDHSVHIAAVVVVDPSDPTQNVEVDILWRISVVPHKDVDDVDDADGQDD